MPTVSLVYVKCVSPSGGVSNGVVIGVAAGAVVLTAAAGVAATVVTAGAAGPAAAGAVAVELTEAGALIGGAAVEGSGIAAAGGAGVAAAAGGAAAGGAAVGVVAGAAGAAAGVISGMTASTGCQIAVVATAAVVESAKLADHVDKSLFSADDFYLKYWVEDSRETRWPADSTRTMDAGQTIDIDDVRIEFSTMAELKLYDADDLSSDDDMGGMRFYADATPGRYTATVTSNIGSVYELMYVVE
ncbi:hypothetical protein ACFPM7_17420 [Actinokineospora guangxiensis]|uniref:Uncharacterized protein n=1 Tax=Actinokineospora guangxiensis TaxID=1490288 RepID=A0ABW0ERX5_9PSEU